MLEIGYRKQIPFSFEIVLAQYFDYEHIAHVHPNTLGEYRLVEVSENRIVYDQIWPPKRNGKRATSRVEQRFFPPNQIEFAFVRGQYRGVRVQTLLQDLGNATQIDETYLLPLPNWAWLKPLARPFMMQSIERIWQEDLDVAVCYGGSPGTPGRLFPDFAAPSPASSSRSRFVGRAEDFSKDSIRKVVVDGEEILAVRRDDQYWALENRCPHRGAPLHLGTIDKDTLICPWHGAQFDLKTGKALCGAAKRDLCRYGIIVQEGDLLLLPTAAEPETAHGDARFE